MNLSWRILVGAVLGVIELTDLVKASKGDKCFTFRECFGYCEYQKCGVPDDIWLSRQPVSMRLLRWDCSSNCNYLCMWDAVKAFEADGTPVPQFFGKWPFIRVLGVQEPASVIFSILNAIPHILMIRKFRQKVPSTAPLYNIWHFYAVVNVNAWFWSTIFHSRDTPFTEKLDYFSAFSLILTGVFVLAARIILVNHDYGSRVFGVRDPSILLITGFCLVLFFGYHVHYLSNVRFDYGYNMKVNIAVGLFSSIGWLYWCYCNRKERPFVWKAAASITAVNLLMVLEVFDFPPLWWTFDAHSLWHAGTAPLGFLWYSFVIDDTLYLVDHPEEKFKEIFLDSEENQTEEKEKENDNQEKSVTPEEKKDL